MKKYTITFLLLCVFAVQSKATKIIADANDYQNYLSSLVAGDTLVLQPGVYANGLYLSGLNGSQGMPIVIMAQDAMDKPVFEGRGCCNTVTIYQCSYLELRNLKMDGKNIQDIDAVKGDGASGNWAHHIVLDSLVIVGHGGTQQTCGISTKCPVWDWQIRNCIIDSAGTGLYLGNSTGDSPFINGVIENNLITNTVGYNMQIKHQLENLRTLSGMTLNGKTIIRYNVFSKDKNASSGGNERPNLLVGNFPDTGDGSKDYYEIYGNFFYQNPFEYLFQGTGNLAFYNNVLVNSVGGGGINITNHNGFNPREVAVFHNTVLVSGVTGIRMVNLDANYQQYAVANAVMAQPATNIVNANANDNVTDTYASVSLYFLDPQNTLPMDLYPLQGPLTGSAIIDTAFVKYTDHDLDFNGDSYDLTYRGAYSGYGSNFGWPLQLANRPTPQGNISTFISNKSMDPGFTLYPNPCMGDCRIYASEDVKNIQLYSVAGILVKTIDLHLANVQLTDLKPGMYLVVLSGNKNQISKQRLVVLAN